MQSQDDRSEGPGGGAESLSVEPRAVSEPARRGLGNVEMPLGIPVTDEEWRELKRRADEPGTPEAAESDPSVEDRPTN
jgi:hypothetical protein